MQGALRRLNTFNDVVLLGRANKKVKAIGNALRT